MQTLISLGTIGMLLARLGDSEWIVLIPDLEVERLDVSQHPVVPLLRGRPDPSRSAK